MVEQLLSEIKATDNLLSIPIEIIIIEGKLGITCSKDSYYEKFIIKNKVDYINDVDRFLVAYKTFDNTLLVFDKQNKGYFTTETTSGLYYISGMIKQGDKISLVKGSKIELYCIQTLL